MFFWNSDTCKWGQDSKQDPFYGGLEWKQWKRLCFWRASLKASGDRGFCHFWNRALWTGCGSILLPSWHWFQVARSGFCPKDILVLSKCSWCVCVCAAWRAYVAGLCGCRFLSLNQADARLLHSFWLDFTVCNVVVESELGLYRCGHATK